jgi:hypothetical protein
MFTTRDKVDIHIWRRYQLTELAPEISANSAYPDDTNLHVHLNALPLYEMRLMPN